MAQRKAYQNAQTFANIITCAVAMATDVSLALESPVFFKSRFKGDKERLRDVHDKAVDILFGQCLSMAEYEGWKIYFGRKFGKPFQQWPTEYQEFVLSKHDSAFEHEPTF